MEETFMRENPERQTRSADPRPGDAAQRRDTARTERLDATASAPRWRPTSAVSGTTYSGNFSQILIRWLQQRGWMYLIGGLVLIVLIFILSLSLLRGDRREAPLGVPTTPMLEQPTTATDIQSGTGTLAPTTAPTPAPRFFVVINTGGQGLFLRPQPNRNNQPIATLPDGTRVEQIGDDVVGADFVWRPVRTPDGLEGYVAVDFLAPAQ